MDFFILSASRSVKLWLGMKNAECWIQCSLTDEEAFRFHYSLIDHTMPSFSRERSAVLRGSIWMNSTERCEPISRKTRITTHRLIRVTTQRSQAREENVNAAMGIGLDRSRFNTFFIVVLRRIYHFIYLSSVHKFTEINFNFYKWKSLRGKINRWISTSSFFIDLFSANCLHDSLLRANAHCRVPLNIIKNGFVLWHGRGMRWMRWIDWWMSLQRNFFGEFRDALNSPSMWIVKMQITSFAGAEKCMNLHKFTSGAIFLRRAFGKEADIARCLSGWTDRACFATNTKKNCKKC